MSFAQYLVAGLIFAAVCIGCDVVGTEPDAVTMSLVALLSACAGCLLA